MWKCGEDWSDEKFLKFVDSGHIFTYPSLIQFVQTYPVVFLSSVLLVSNKQETLQTEDSEKKNDLKKGLWKKKQSQKKPNIVLSNLVAVQEFHMWTCDI